MVAMKERGDERKLACNGVVSHTPKYVSSPFGANYHGHLRLNTGNLAILPPDFALING
jgi:hypothetical protein